MAGWLTLGEADAALGGGQTACACGGVWPAQGGGSASDGRRGLPRPLARQLIWGTHRLSSSCRRVQRGTAASKARLWRGGYRPGIGARGVGQVRHLGVSAVEGELAGQEMVFKGGCAVQCRRANPRCT